MGTVKGVGGGEPPHYYRGVSSTDKNKIKNSLVSAALQPVFASTKINGDSVRQLLLIELMMKFLEDEMAKSGVKADFTEKATFYNPEAIAKLKELIGGIENPKTQQKLLETLNHLIQGR